MKLRIKGNSIRLRLSLAEIVQVQCGQSVVETLFFGEASRLSYSLDSSPHIGSISATFDGTTVRVLVPATVLIQWARSEEVSIENAPSIGVNDALSVLIEKDFF
jgi:hypothetical protein